MFCGEKKLIVPLGVDSAVRSIVRDTSLTTETIACLLVKPVPTTNIPAKRPVVLSTNSVTLPPEPPDIYSGKYASPLPASFPIAIAFPPTLDPLTCP